MAEHTKISWCDHTFNPWVGCTRISNGPQGACLGCYAAAMMEDRYHRVVFGGPGKGVGTRERTSTANWRKPIAWNKAAAAAGTRPFVFCASLADVFDNEVEPAWRADLFELIRATPRLVWLLLTKRPGNVVDQFAETLRVSADEHGPLDACWPRNAAIGCTVVTQQEADRDIPKFLAAKAALNPAFAFLSMEPLMGAADIAWALSRNPLDIASGFIRRGHFSPGLETVGRVDWVITGGETNQGAHQARPSHPDWFRDIRDACAAAGVPYHHKQNGEFQEFDTGSPRVEEVDASDDAARSIFDLAERPVCIDLQGNCYADIDDIPEDVPARLLERVGKHRAGRTLDGLVHDARPEVRA